MPLGGGFGGGLGGGYTPRPYTTPAPASGGLQYPGGPTMGPPYSQYATDAQNYRDFYTSYYAPTLAGYDQQSAAANARLGAIQAATGAGNGAASAQAAIRSKQLDNMIAGTRIDINAIPRQIGYNNDVYGVNGQQYNSTDQMLQQLQGLVGSEFDVTKQKALLDLATGRRQVGNDAAARGAVTAPETGNALKDLQANYGLTERAAYNTRDTANAQLTNQRNQALYDYTLQGLSTKEQNAKLKDRGAQLDLQAANYKLDKDALLAGLNASLAASNLQGILTAGQVLDGINSNNVQKAQLMNEIVYGAVAYANGQGNFGGAANPPATAGSGGGLPRLGK